MSAERLPSVWFLTRHAVDRWQERVAPHATDAETTATLSAISREAVDTGAETNDGRPLYFHADWPMVRFVVARPAPDEPLPTLLTVADAPAVRARQGKVGGRHARRRG